MIRIASTAVLIGLLALSVVGAAGGEPAWEGVVRDLRSRRDGLLSTLTRARSVLAPRARGERPDLLSRLALDPGPLPSGYRVLPAIDDDVPLGAVATVESVYSIERLERRFVAAASSAGTLVADATAAEPRPLATLATEFERLRDELRNLEQHLAYHDYWQKALVAHPGFYAERNRLVVLARELQAELDDGGPLTRAAELREAIVNQVAPFTKTGGLAIDRSRGGSLRLPVTVCTDIAERRFLRLFRRGVREAYDRSPAARARRFSVDLRFRRVAGARLYPEGPPPAGSQIDLREHRARFADCPFVLTTGADSTYAWLGDSILLGPTTLSPRALAHEFGHLVGFSDAYVRGYDGDPADPYGAVIVEWTGITDDLMGNPGLGRVSDGMIDTLIRAYGPDG